jgi:hypothetical protein
MSVSTFERTTSDSVLDVEEIRSQTTDLTRQFDEARAELESSPTQETQGQEELQIPPTIQESELLRDQEPTLQDEGIVSPQETSPSGTAQETQDSSQ